MPDVGTSARQARRDSRVSYPISRAPMLVPLRMSAMRSSETATATAPTRGQRLDVDRGASRRKEQHEHRDGAALNRLAQHVARLAQHTLDDDTRGDAGEQRLELQTRAEAGDDGAEREQHDRDLAADEPDVEREQRAEHGAKGCGSQQRPGRRPRKRPEVAEGRAERVTRRLQADREEHDDGDLDEHDRRRGRRRERSARPTFRDDRHGDRRGDADEHRRRERHGGGALEAGERRTDRQPRPDHVQHDDEADPRQANRHDRAQPGDPARADARPTSSCSPAMKAMSAIEKPLAARRSRAIGSVMMLATNGPQTRPNAR